MPNKKKHDTTPRGNGLYILRKAPKAEVMQPQIFTILSTLQTLGGKAPREKLVKAVSKRMDTSQGADKVVSLKRRWMLDNGYLQIKKVA